MLCIVCSVAAGRSCFKHHSLEWGIGMGMIMTGTGRGWGQSDSNREGMGRKVVPVKLSIVHSQRVYLNRLPRHVIFIQMNFS